MPPAVSVIIPVYRTPLGMLERCLNSALTQTLREIEVIAVDDASADACPALLDVASARDPRLRVIHRAANGRAGAARNDGLAAAFGDFVVFADADDVLVPEMCATLHALAQQHAADIVACAWSVQHADGRPARSHTLPQRRYDLGVPREKRRCFHALGHMLWNRMFRRAAIADLRFAILEANVGEDLLFNVGALCRARTVATTPFCGYRYTLHAASATGRPGKGMPYLNALVATGERLRETLRRDAGARFAQREGDRLALALLATGCDWIAESSDATEQAQLWAFWHRDGRARLLPEGSSGLLSAVGRAVSGGAVGPGPTGRWLRRLSALGNLPER